MSPGAWESVSGPLLHSLEVLSAPSLPQWPLFLVLNKELRPFSVSLLNRAGFLEFCFKALFFF